MNEDVRRYARQTAVQVFGPDGQAALSASTIAIIGCGALGAMQAEILTRMGVGHLRIADADVVSIDNLHRQLLFTERDAIEKIDKVAAATARLANLNARVAVHAVAQRITHDTIAAFIDGADLVLDATDNAATRYLINDYCVRENIPWIYAGVAGTRGLVLPVLPHAGPCLRCLYPDAPAENEIATGAVEGVLPITVSFAVSLQLTQAFRILRGTAKPGTLVRFDVWDASTHTMTVRRNPDCPCCGRGRFESLD